MAELSVNVPYTGWPTEITASLRTHMPRSSSPPANDLDSRYREVLLDPIRKSALYRPRMGNPVPVDLEAFQAAYSADPLYSWMGLDTPLMYAAHRAAGGITSFYRQLGIGCERLWRQIIIDSFGVPEDRVSWSYTTPTAAGNPKRLTLDARIDSTDVKRKRDRDRFSRWLANAQGALESAVAPAGAVFEVRQGYKSKDSKRQQADIDNASHALKHLYVPTVVLFSQQMDGDLQLRYRQNNWIVLVGDADSSDPIESTYAFARRILGVDLAAFFVRNSAAMCAEVEAILTTLLSAEQ